jgi:hypothetical protein
MSHHLDTPLAAKSGQLYLDDLYVFPGEASTVFVMDVNSNVNGLYSSCPPDQPVTPGPGRAVRGPWC